MTSPRSTMPRSRGMPHIVADARMLGASGIGTYLRNMLPRVVAVRPDWRFTVLGSPTELASVGLDPRANLEIHEVRAPIYSVYEQLELPRHVPSNGAVFWSPHYNIPLATSARLVVTIQDVMHLVLPEYTRTWIRRRYARGMFDMVRRRAAAVICGSEFTRGELTRIVGECARMSVASNGVEEGWFDVSRA